jgi:hypothetical protein
MEKQICTFSKMGIMGKGLWFSVEHITIFVFSLPLK